MKRPYWKDRKSFGWIFSRRGNPLGCFGLLFFILIGLSVPSISKGDSGEKPTLGIIPFQYINRMEHPTKRVVTCPLCKGIYKHGEIIPNAEKDLTQIFYNKMEALGRFNLLALEKVEEAIPPSLRSQIERDPFPSIQKMGKDLGIDFLFIGCLFRFEQRLGSSIGVERPASVGFDVHLFRLRDGKMVWVGKFEETQRPLSENLLKIGAFFRRKASWLTAEELSCVGMDEMLKKLPGLKELEEKP